MTKEEAIAFVIAKTEEIEKERLRVNLSIDATRQKKGVVYAILKDRLVYKTHLQIELILFLLYFLP